MSADSNVIAPMAGGAMTSERSAGRRQVADRRVRQDPFYDGTDRRHGRGRRVSEASPRTENLLEPADPESYLRVPVILSRISTEFDYVETDEAAGQRHVEEMIKQVLERTDSIGNGDHHERAKHLASVQPEAVQVRCGDNPTSESEFLSAMLVPGEPILFSYESLAQEIAARPLLQRLAKALGYKVVQWETSYSTAN
jgi:hypothetical protein